MSVGLGLSACGGANGEAAVEASPNLETDRPMALNLAEDAAMRVEAGMPDPDGGVSTAAVVPMPTPHSAAEGSNDRQAEPAQPATRTDAPADTSGVARQVDAERRADDATAS